MGNGGGGRGGSTDAHGKCPDVQGGLCHHVGAWMARLRPVPQSKSLPERPSIGLRPGLWAGLAPALASRPPWGHSPSWTRERHSLAVFPPLTHGTQFLGREGKGKNSCFKFWQNRLT